MNKSTFTAICCAIITLSTSCVKTTSLNTYYTRRDNIDKNKNVVFVKSGGQCDENLKLVQILENEKNATTLNLRNNIEIINITEQREVQKFLIFNISEEICYTYDVVLVGDKLEADNKIEFLENNPLSKNTKPKTSVNIEPLKNDSSRINKIGSTKVAEYFDANFEVAETPGSKLPSVDEFMKGITYNWFAVDWNSNYLTSELDDIGNPIIIKVINFEFDPRQGVNKDDFIIKSGNKKRHYHYFLIEDKDQSKKNHVPK